jgi:hypothetical protein
MLCEFLYRRIAFALIAGRDDNDEGLGLGTGLEKFVDQAGPDTEPEAAGEGSMVDNAVGARYTNLLAPVTST